MAFGQDALLAPTLDTRPADHPTTPAGTVLALAGRWEVRLAASPAEIHAAQRLRLAVFGLEQGAHIESRASGRDVDRFDPVCRHLLVCDRFTGEVVATTRLLSAAGAAAVGGFYSAQEFDLAMLDDLTGPLLEVGRTCVAAGYRDGAVVGLLWQGLARLVREEGVAWMFGCASIGVDVRGRGAEAVLERVLPRYLTPDARRARPYFPLPAGRAEADEADAGLPPLLKAYLSLGARVAGPAAWDRAFGTADLLVLLHVPALDGRYARRFGLADARALAPAAPPALGSTLREAA